MMVKDLGDFFNFAMLSDIEVEDPASNTVYK